MEAMQGCHDDTVMACAMALEVLRTHSSRLTTDKISWRDRIGNIVSDDETNWL